MRESCHNSHCREILFPCDRFFFFKFLYLDAVNCYECSLSSIIGFFFLFSFPSLRTDLKFPLFDVTRLVWTEHRTNTDCLPPSFWDWFTWQSSWVSSAFLSYARTQTALSPPHAGPIQKVNRLNFKNIFLSTIWKLLVFALKLLKCNHAFVMYDVVIRMQSACYLYGE